MARTSGGKKSGGTRGERAPQLDINDTNARPGSPHTFRPKRLASGKASTAADETPAGASRTKTGATTRKRSTR